MIIPTYPNFKIITSDDIQLIRGIIDKYPSYSDFNPISLLCWNADNTNAYTLLKDNIVIRLKNYLGEGHIYSIMGGQALNESIQILFNNEVKATKTLNMVPEVVVEKLTDDCKYHIKEDRDSFDYIISLDKMCALANKNLRKHVEHFKQSFPTYKVAQLDLNRSDQVQDIIDLTLAWCTSKGFDHLKTFEDLKSVRTFIDIHSMFSYEAVGVYVDSKLTAYTLNEILTADMAMGHLGKALNNYKYAALFCEYATNTVLKNTGLKYINIQQDTGLPGLRETKTSYNPEYFLKKYTIALT